MSNGGQYETMANGELLNEVLKILTQEKDIPDVSPQAIARLTLAAQVQMYKLHNGLSKEVVQNKQCISNIKDILEELEEKEAERKKFYSKLWIGVIIAFTSVILDVVIHLLGVV